MQIRLRFSGTIGTFGSSNIRRQLIIAPILAALPKDVVGDPAGHIALSERLEGAGILPVFDRI